MWPLALCRISSPKCQYANCSKFFSSPTGSYSCLKVDLLFKREFSYYLIQIYIPCCMLVIVSWVSFWLDPNAIPARVSLGVTTLLTMATSISGINSSLPPVSYTKAIDVWTGVCLTFVFGALLEFALVNYASRSDAHRAALKQQQAAFAAQRKWDMEQAAALEGDHLDDRTASAFAMASIYHLNPKKPISPHNCPSMWGIPIMRARSERQLDKLSPSIINRKSRRDTKGGHGII